MSFTRINYDKCAVDLDLERSVAQGNYRLDGNYIDNCKKCHSYHTVGSSTEAASSVRDNCDTGFGSLADAESIITNRKRYLQKCNKEGKNDDYKDFKLNHKPLCERGIESEDTRFTNPLDNYRGMSLTGYYFTPYLHINPQCHIQSTKHREGSSSRLMVKDCYSKPSEYKSVGKKGSVKDIFWDEGKALPPKPKQTKKKTKCKSCCD